jgi:type VI secretion system protein
VQAGLIDILRGHFLSGMPVAEEDEGQHRILSIIDNLTRLFNTRRGSIEHLPDYGLPDITQVYRDLPYSIDGLRAAIRDVVEKYEPRLRRVRVEKQEKEKEDEYDMRVSFIVSGELLKGQKVQFQAAFASNDLAEVRPWRKPS